MASLRLHVPGHEGGMRSTWLGWRYRWWCSCGAGARERQPSTAITAFHQHYRDGEQR